MWYRESAWETRQANAIAAWTSVNLRPVESKLAKCSLEHQEKVVSERKKQQRKEVGVKKES